MRSTNAPASRQRRKRFLKQARGYYGARSRLYRTARETVERSMNMATAHRRARKRDFRALWIARLSAAARLHGLTYNRLIQGLTKAGVALNRKMLSEIAIHDPAGFGMLISIAREKLS